jgi:peroxiredoxin
MHAYRQIKIVRIGTRQRDGATVALFIRKLGGIAAVALITCLFSLPFDAFSAQQKPLDSTKTTIAEKAPDFVLTDLQGQKFRLSDHRGKRPVLIIFSTTWCTFCKAEIPHFKSLHATYAKQGLEVVNIDIQESQEKVSKFAAQNQLPYRVLLDRDGTVSGVYDVRGVPTMVLVDSNGLIACRQCRTVETLLESMMKP